MLDELLISSSLLCAAIDRYSSVCLAIQRSYARGEKPHITTPQLALQMGTEARLVASLENKLQKAKAAISWSRNHSNTHTTINDLPLELLAHIFQLVQKAEPCAKRNYDSGKKTVPIYPAILSVVCSRWREIALGTPALWTHLDISTSALLNRQRLDGLVRLHSIRAGHLSLDFHAFDSPGYDMSYAYLPMNELIIHLAYRVASFDLDASGALDYGTHYDMLSNFLDNCSPGRLTRLTLSQWGDGHEFIRGYDGSDDEDPDDQPGLGIGPPTEEFEDILSRISVLRLHKLYPQWNSRAYHGLIELRLTGWETIILESELLGILRSSPDMRILQFGLVIRDPLPGNCSSHIAPVRLNNLEVLNLAEMRTEQLNSLLRWIVPGPKLLQFAVKSGYGHPDPQFKEESSRLFFSRSRIARAYVKNISLSHVIELLDLSPDLQVLAVRGIPFKESGYSASLTSERQLECFYMIYCSVNLDLILTLMDNPMLIIGALSFYRCSFYLDGEELSENQVASHVEELSRVFPGVRLILQGYEVAEPDPIYNWDLYASYQMVGLNAP